MITKIVISNIESHERTVVPLAEGCNCIVGQSDTGKSAFIRALKSMMFFEGFNPRYDLPSMSIRVVMGDDEIERKRTDKVTYKCKACGELHDNLDEFCSACEAPSIVVNREKDDDVYLVNGSPYREMGRGFNSLDKRIKESMPMVTFHVGKKLCVPGFKTQEEPYLFTYLTPSELNQFVSMLEGHDIVDVLIKVFKSKHLNESKIEQFLGIGITTAKAEYKSLRNEFIGLKADYLQEREYHLKRGELLTRLEALAIYHDKLKRNRIKRAKLASEISEVPQFDVEVLEKLVAEADKYLAVERRYKELAARLKENARKSDGIEVIDCDAAEKIVEKYTKLLNAKELLDGNAQRRKEIDVAILSVSADIKALEKRMERSNICVFSGFPLAPQCKEIIRQAGNQFSIGDDDA